jgi:hypothetical protein
MEPKRKKPKRKTAFVPSVVFTTAVAGVVPACVLGCGNNGGGTTPPGVANCAYGSSSGNCPTVAAVGYCAFCDGGRGDATTEAGADVATDAPEAGDAAGDAPGDASQDVPFSVADAGFRGD